MERRGGHLRVKRGVAALVLAVSVRLAAGAQASSTGAAGQAEGKPSAISAQGAALGEGGALLQAVREQINAGHTDAALRQLDVLAARRPPLSGVQRLRGVALYGQAKLQEADKAFAEALRTDPQDEEAAQMRGLTLFRLGRPKEAIPLLQGAQRWGAETKVDPSYVLALCYMDTLRFEDARHAFAAQYGFPGDSAQAYLLAGRMLFRREMVPTAKEFATKALELDPQIPLGHALLGEISLAGEHLDEAIAELEKERVRDPLDGPVYDRLGDAYYRAGRYTEAQQSLQRALLLEPDATGPYILLGKVLLQRHDPVGASTYLERAALMDPANYRTHALLGQAYRALGRREDASRELQKAQSLQAASGPKLESVH